MRPITKGLLLLAGLAVPSAMAAVFLFGCCVLPFHKYLHGAMPICHMASEVLTGHHEGDEHGENHPATPATSREKSASRVLPPVRTLAAELFPPAQASAQSLDPALTSIRSFVSLGAVRCENDVGLHLLLTTFLI